MNEVERYYDEQAHYEWQRFDRHHTEFAVTLRAFAEHLPPAPARVLDVGGGPGRYTIELARQGYLVTELDLSAASLEFAAARAAEAGVRVEGFVHGSATDLSTFADGSFDAVMLMGPLYHLLELTDRERAVREAARVLRPGGVVFAAFISRYAELLDYARRQPEAIVEQGAAWEETISTGLMLGGQTVNGFTNAYLTHQREVEPLMRAGDFEPNLLLAAEGIRDFSLAEVERLPAGAWDAWVDLHYRLGQDPCLLGSAAHLLYVGRKPLSVGTAGT